MHALHAWFTATLALAVLGLALGLWAVAGQAAVLRTQLHASQAAYTTQEHNDRQALRGLGRSLGGIVRRDVAAYERNQP